MAIDSGPFVLVRWRDTTTTGGWYRASDLASDKQYKSRVVAEKAAKRMDGVVVRPVGYIKNPPRRRSVYTKNPPVTVFANPPRALTFADLPVGTLFEFDRTGLPLSSGIARGPWIKTSARKYDHVDDSGLRNVRIGSTRARVVTVTEIPAAGFQHNPSHRRHGETVSTRVYEIRYRHSADGKNYRHPFKAGVCAELLPDGSVRLYHAKGRPLMKDF